MVTDNAVTVTTEHSNMWMLSVQRTYGLSSLDSKNQLLRRNAAENHSDWSDVMFHSFWVVELAQTLAKRTCEFGPVVPIRSFWTRIQPVWEQFASARVLWATAIPTQTISWPAATGWDASKTYTCLCGCMWIVGCKIVTCSPGGYCVACKFWNSHWLCCSMVCSL